MERSLNPDLLGLALGGHDALPSPQELSQLLADAEIAMLLRGQNVPDRLVATGWYLHGVASSKYALNTYGIERHRAAFQVAGHIFDLKLQTPELPVSDKLKYCFAAQIAYARSSLDPNSLALYRREFSEGLGEYTLISDFQMVSLACGVSFLGFDIRYVYQLTSSITDEVEALLSIWEIDDITSTIYGAVANVVSGTRDLMSFLVYGRPELLERARVKLRTAVTSDSSLEDGLSRWIAAHLLSFSDNLENSTIWNVLPPDVPISVRRAFVNGEPRILTLWPPQIDFLGIEGENNPLSDNVKRLLLSTPTSGGKTLAAQLLITAHLSTQNTSVCYVAPTRSLCREVRKSLQSRLRFIDRQIIDGLPEGDWLGDILDSLRPDVEVMTPERLSYLLRTDSGQVLERFGMFIFDEVHLVGDETRGWTLEEDLSYLHFATAHLHHKIVLISAVIGNRNHIVQWLSSGNGERAPLEFHSDWRGPRRIHAVWTTSAVWSDTVAEPTGAPKYRYRKTTPLYGQLNVRISNTGLFKTFFTENSIGELVQKAETEHGVYTKDSSKSTAFYRMLVPLIDYLAEFGPVLVIESTKPATIRLAEAIAETKGPIERQQIVNLIDLVVTRLGSEHPLKRTLEKGIAYHHGSLPSEIRVALEEAVSAGYLKYIVATTTLTEGINLPVTSVVIASQGAYVEEGNLTEYIVGSKLINAIGRAGRATKETEGIVVLARSARPNPDDFDRLNPNEEDLRVDSMLATEKALEALAEFEELYRVAEDAIFEVSGSEIANFLKFVWFISAEFEKLNQIVHIDQIEQVLRQTLGWVQLEPSNRTRWLQAANIALNQYENTDESVRRRWASSGTSIRSSRMIERIVQSVISDLAESSVPQEIVASIEFIIGNGRLQQILELPEAPKRPIYTRRGGNNRVEIDVPIDRLLNAWLRGASLIEIANMYLADVLDVDFRFEQLGDFIYSRFELFLPWVLGTIVSWVNQLLRNNGSTALFPSNLPANIRYGVNDSVALELMVRGIQSRRLAIRISESWQSHRDGNSVIVWIRTLSLTQFIEMFNASPNEIRNLLDVSRVERGGAGVDLFNTGRAEIEVRTESEEYPPTQVTLHRFGDSEFTPVGVWDGESQVGTIFGKDQSDIISLLNTGLAFSTEFSVTSGRGMLRLMLIEPE